MKSDLILSKCRWCGCTYIKSKFPHLVFPREMNETFGQEYKVSKYKMYCSEDCHDRERLFHICNHLEYVKIHGKKNRVL